jgi:prepilin signal peptidase PulO-like enzyme (type II secretory pathway)
MIGLIIGGLLGFLAGILVNALADDLPYRRNPGLPVYPDGTPRPIAAWSGILAFVFNLRAPIKNQPNQSRSRYPWYIPPQMPDETSPDSEEEDITEKIKPIPLPEKPTLNWRYPLTELLTMGLCILAVNTAQEQNLSLVQVLFWLAYMAIYALITVIDVEHKLILFIVIIPSAVLALINAVFFPEVVNTPENALWGAVAGFVPFFILYQGGFIFTYILGQARGEKIDTVAFGYGDVMLMTLSGLILGLDRTIIALFITVFLGAMGAIGYMLLRAVLGRRYSLFTAIPYGPYIVAAFVIMLLYGDAVRKALLGY